MYRVSDSMAEIYDGSVDLLLVRHFEYMTGGIYGRNGQTDGQMPY